MAVANKNLEKLPDSKLECLRCSVPMKEAGESKFATWDLFVGSEGVERLQMLVCPRCGKVEMFV